MTRERRASGRAPGVVAERLAGVAIGGRGLGWVPEHGAVLELLAEVGFV
jgi:Kef-type K+ transport system membrane component KefB